MIPLKRDEVKTQRFLSALDTLEEQIGRARIQRRTLLRLGQLIEGWERDPDIWVTVDIYCASSGPATVTLNGSVVTAPEREGYIQDLLQWTITTLGKPTAASPNGHYYTWVKPFRYIINFIIEKNQP